MQTPFHALVHTMWFAIKNLLCSSSIARERCPLSAGTLTDKIGAIRAKLETNAKTRKRLAMMSLLNQCKDADAHQSSWGER
jgi:hypothetical protein